MTKEKNNIFFILTIVILEILLLINPSILITSVKESIELFMNKLFVTLFPFFVLNSILLEYNFQYYISIIGKNILAKILKISNISLSIIILSLLTGHPSNAKYIKDFLDKKIISVEEATKLLIITYLPNPFFVITIIGYILFNDIFIGIIMLLTIYLINFILGLFIRNKIIVNELNKKIEIKNNQNLTIILKDSFINSFKTLMIILGNIIIFTIIINLFNNYIHINPIIDSILSSIFELTTGINKISSLSTDFSIKFTLCVSALTFCGLSIHSQIMSILSDYNINFKLIFKYRLIATVISTTFLILILKCMELCF